jgi:hypothetical protein
MKTTRTIAEYLASLTEEDRATYLHVMNRVNYLPMIAADGADYQVMRRKTHVNLTTEDIAIRADVLKRFARRVWNDAQYKPSETAVSPLMSLYASYRADDADYQVMREFEAIRITGEMYPRQTGNASTVLLVILALLLILPALGHGFYRMHFHAHDLGAFAVLAFIVLLVKAVKS